MVHGESGDPGSGTRIPERRVVLLGASNLIVGLPRVVEAARSMWGGRLDILAAAGHGRSYGYSSRVLWRALPAILSCGLWEDLARRPPASTAALLTDVGNDILYGAPTSVIAEWVEACLARLAVHASRLVITELPLESIQGIGRFRFLLMRRLLFPACRVALRDAQDAARDLNDRVRTLAARYEASIVKPNPTWYGFDPIHIRLRHQAAAWSMILSQWSPPHIARGARLAWRERFLLSGLKPQRRTMFGRRQQHAQPAGFLRDGSWVSLY